MSAKMRAKIMRNKNAFNLPDYMVIAASRNQVSATLIPPQSTKEGKRTAIPVLANLISKENTYEHLAMNQGDSTSKNMQYQRVMERLLRNQDMPEYRPLKLPELPVAK